MTRLSIIVTALAVAVVPFLGLLGCSSELAAGVCSLVNPDNVLEVRPPVALRSRSPGSPYKNEVSRRRLDTTPVLRRLPASPCGPSFAPAAREGAPGAGPQHWVDRGDGVLVPVN